MLLCALLALLLAACSGAGDGPEATVDFGQYHSDSTGAASETEADSGAGASGETQEGETGESGTGETGAGESAGDGYVPDEEAMAAFQQSRYAQELLDYFASEGRGDEAFSEPIFDSETRLYTQEELMELSADLCKIFRNEIYARHGMIFGEEDLNQLYGAFSWYEGTTSMAEFESQPLPFNETEIANIHTVIDAEEANGYR